MNSIKIKGNKFRILGNIPAVGDEAPDVTFVTKDLQEVSVYDEEGKVRVLISVPSLDTGVCATETRRFNKELAGLKAEGYVISKDLPFAQRRFCETEGIKNVHPVSDYRYNDFCAEYGVEIIEGPMKGLAARAIFVIDKKNIIRYVQVVEETTTEPDYEEVLEAIKKLV